jgi:hypothetical protein
MLARRAIVQSLSALLALFLAFAALRPAFDCGECKPCCRPAPADQPVIRALMACCEPGRVVEAAPQPPSRTSEQPTVLAALSVPFSPPVATRNFALSRPLSAPQRPMPLYERLLL